MPAKDRPKQVGIMKAKTATDKLIRDIGTTCYAQPKLRGQRCRVVWLEGQRLPILVSSYGNAFSFMGHIQRQLSLLPRLNYDGELYVHDPEWTQQKINSVCNRTVNPHKESSRVSYWIFDIITEEAQSRRFAELCYKLRSFLKANALMLRDHKGVYLKHTIKLLDTTEIPTAEWMTYAQNYLAHGYEGIILRHLQNTYQPLSPFADAKRPSSILKFKPTVKKEYEIIGVNEGVGWATGSLGSFVVKLPDSQATFNVGTGPTKAQRRKYWIMREDLIGKRLLVKHEPVETSNGIPICTVAMEVR